MKVLRDIQQIGPIHLMIGNYDGVHLGHQSIFVHLKEKAKNDGFPVGLLSFFPHPRHVLKPDQPLNLIHGPQEKQWLLKRMGLDFYLEVPFSKALSRLSPDQFLNWIAELKMQSICVGSDFRYGNQRTGDVAHLQQFAKKRGIDLVLADDFSVAGVRCSSTAIRQALNQANLAKASKMLGRPYFMTGTIVGGYQVGRRIGFATANLQSEVDCLVPNGVYASWMLAGGDWYRSITNIGVRPTFGGERKQIETHLLDQDQDLYQQKAVLVLNHHIRPETTFSGVDQLRAQIQNDIGTRLSMRDQHPYEEDWKELL